MWSAQSTFSAFYLRDVTHRHLDTFSIGPVVAAQQVMSPTNASGSGVVTLGIGLCAVVVFVTLGSRWPSCCDVSSPTAASSLLSSNFDQRELQKPYTQEPIVGS